VSKPSFETTKVPAHDSPCPDWTAKRSKCPKILVAAGAPAVLCRGRLRRTPLSGIQLHVEPPVRYPTSADDPVHAPVRATTARVGAPANNRRPKATSIVVLRRMGFDACACSSAFGRTSRWPQTPIIANAYPNRAGMRNAQPRIDRRVSIFRATWNWRSDAVHRVPVQPRCGPHRLTYRFHSEVRIVIL